MKVGILTWYYGKNYGAKLHSYALQSILKENGIDCEFINYNHIKNYNIKELRNHVSIRNPQRYVQKILSYYKIKKFEKKLIIGNKINHVMEINNNYDVVILGSDEILKLSHWMFSKINYGVGITQKKIIFGADSGQTDINFKLPDEIINSLRSVKRIMVRGTLTQKLLMNNGIQNTKVVLDPTLLYDFDNLSGRFEEDNYILIYAFYGMQEYKETIVKYAKAHNLKIVAVYGYIKWADRNYLHLYVEQWVEAIRRASLVVTDSFHGICFSIKFHKEIVPIGSKSKVNKIKGVFDTLNINRKFLKPADSVEKLLEDKIEYSLVEETIIKKRKEALEDLISAILEE